MGLIKDGTGSGLLAKVDKNNRLRVDSISLSSANFHAIHGHRYNLNTGNITITNATECGVFYLKNNEDKDLIVDSVVYILGDSTGGSGDSYATIIRNPTSGTVVSEASSVSMNSNLNYSSSNTLDIDAYKGGTGKTLSGGDDSLGSIMTDSTTNIVSVGNIVIPKGNSLGIKYTAPSGNTSQVCQFAALCYLDHTESGV